MNKRKILLFLLLLVTFKLSAVEHTNLIIDMHNGSRATVRLLDRPRITFEGEIMKIVSQSNSMEFKRSDVKHYRFYRRVVTSVEEQRAVQPLAAITENRIIVSGIAIGTVVTVYTATGTAVCSATAAGDECAVSLDSLPCGLYIVAYNDTTIKFFKK